MKHLQLPQKLLSVFLTLFLAAMLLPAMSLKANAAETDPATVLANQILGSGVSIVPGSAKFDLISNQLQATTFQLNSTTDANIISTLGGLSSGIVLSSGSAANALIASGDENSNNNNYGGEEQDSDLQALCSFPTYDTVALEFQIANVPTDKLVFNYIFATDEMNEGAKYNDAFGLFVKDGSGAFVNVAKLSNYGDGKQDVTVGNLKTAIASENYCGTAASIYAAYNYDSSNAEDPYQINEYLPYDGITKLYTATANVTKGNTVTVKLVVADVSDKKVDSSVFIQGGSLTFASNAPTVATLDSSGCIDNSSGNATLTLKSAHDGTCYVVPAGNYADKAALDAVSSNKLRIDTKEGVVSAPQNIGSFLPGEYYAYFVNSQDTLSDPASFYISTHQTLTYNYNYNGSTNTTASDLNGHFMTQVPPTRVGYEFGGWYLDSACTNAFDTAATRIPVGGLTLYAKWVPGAFDVNSDYVITPPEAEPHGYEMKLAMYTGIDTVPTQIAQTNPTLSTPAAVENALKISADNALGTGRELTVDYFDLLLWVSTDNGATWEKATVDNFPVGGITVVIPWANLGVTYEQAQHMNFSVTHMFSTSANGHTPGTTETPAWTVTENGLRFTVDGLSPIAVAYKTMPMVTYDANNGNSETSTAYTAQDGKLSSLPTPTRSGYTFEGWYTAAVGGDKISTDTVFSADTTVYAHWTVSTSPQTGDNSHIALLTCLMMTGLLGMVTATVFYRRKQAE